MLDVVVGSLAHLVLDEPRGKGDKTIAKRGIELVDSTHKTLTASLYEVFERCARRKITLGNCDDIAKMVDECETVLVAEEGYPFIEEQVRGVFESQNILGRLTGELPRTGELTPDCVGQAINAATGSSLFNLHSTFERSEIVAARPPQLCQGCGHRDVYTALNEVLKEYENPRVFGDIGCYTLGFLPPYRAIHSCVDMGASITMAKGASDAGQWPAVAIIGDSTFTHSGMTGLLDAVNEKANITVIISDNLTTAMTGGQDSAGTNKFEAICLGLGVEPEHLHVVVPLPKNMPEITRIIREEINYNGVSVIIPQRECIVFRPSRDTLNKRGPSPRPLPCRAGSIYPPTMKNRFASYKSSSPDRYQMLREYARKNRQNATLAEQFLWEHLRGTALGVNFMRQHIIGDYIVDFVSRHDGLVIEVDGGYHSEPRQQADDAIREHDLEDMGYHVMRFSNEEVLYDINSVIEQINSYFDNEQQS